MKPISPQQVPVFCIFLSAQLEAILNEENLAHFLSLSSGEKIRHALKVFDKVPDDLREEIMKEREKEEVQKITEKHFGLKR